MEEIRRADRPDTSQREAASVCYQHGELLRLRGDFEAAEEAYREASKHGREPQPGLALLRLAQGKAETASASISHKDCSAQAASRSLVAVGRSCCLPHARAATKNSSMVKAV